MEGQATIQDLYEGKATLKVKFAENDVPFSVKLMERELNIKTMEFEDAPDCKVESWTANRWFRTEKGANREKYNRIADLKREITKAGKQRGLTVEAYTIEAIEVEV